MSFMVRLITTALACCFSITALAAPPAPVKHSHYRSMSFSEFLIDAPRLAAHHSTVTLTGFYVRLTPPDSPAGGILSNAARDISTQVLTIAVDLSHASPALLTALAKCPNTPLERMLTGPWDGCMVTVWGQAEWSPAIDNSWMHKEAFAGIDVMGGEPYVPPPPPLSDEEKYAQQQSDQLAACIHSPEMAHVGDVYRKCLAKLGQPVPPNP